ncbi:MAG: hypothetical protein JWR19_2801 [Pedosphaera sp.]|jgi:uncharacterized membrane protein|nr:hypothetical protein [Pedosphaera sp.]
MHNSRLTKFISPEAAIPVLALLFATVVGTILVGLRIVWTGHWTYLFLLWNLFLAWLPLVFALGVSRQCRAGTRGRWRLGLLAALWLLFLPNAPYIFTDLIHLNTWFRAHYWVDLSLILLFAFTGFLLGFLSLYLMQSVVASRVGKAASWLFILVAAGLSGFGVYLGRMLRWNSWDVLTNPLGLTQAIGHWAVHPLNNPGTSIGFPLLFATFLFLGYLMLYALTHLQPAPMNQPTT